MTEFKKVADNRKTSPGNSEEKTTQPFVNTLLAAALPELQMFFCSLREKPPTELAGDEVIQNPDSTFLFFAEKKTIPTFKEPENCIHEQRRHHRRPDAAFFETCFVKDATCFDAAARRSVRVSVKVKRFLDRSHCADALIECERDLVTLTTRWPSALMRVGYSIVTDGIEWRFLKIFWVCELMGWKRNIQMSSPISAETLQTDGGLELAKWLAFIVRQSVLNPKQESGFAFVYPFFKGQETANGRVESVYGLSSRFLTMCCTVNVPVGNGGAQKVVVKRRLFYADGVIEAGSRRTEKNEEYLKKEIQMLKLLEGTSNVAKFAEGFAPNGNWPALHLEYDGISLDKFDIRGERGIMLCEIVKKSIHDGALEVLKKKGYAHCDIHEANIVVSIASEKAILIDFESATLFNEETKHSPTRNFVNKGQLGATMDLQLGATMEDDRTAVLALMACLYRPEDSDFALRKTWLFVEKNKKFLLESFSPEHKTGFNTTLTMPRAL